MSELTSITPQSRTLEILHPATNSPIGIRVTVCSIDDPALAQVKRRITDERMNLERKNKTLKAADIEENRIKILMAAVRGWEWYSPTGNEEDMPQYKGEVLEYKPVNVRAMIADEGIRWFSDQINAEISETERFFDNK